MYVYVLLYETGQENEGIHSLEISGSTLVLMFEDKDDAERYCGLLEAQDFPKPTVEKIEKKEIEIFCNEAGYDARFIESGFLPKTQEDRYLLAPPESSLDVSRWNEKESNNNSNINEIRDKGIDPYKDFRKKLEDLI